MTYFKNDLKVWLPFGNENHRRFINHNIILNCLGSKIISETSSIRCFLSLFYKRMLCTLTVKKFKNFYWYSRPCCEHYQWVFNFNYSESDYTYQKTFFIAGELSILSKYVFSKCMLPKKINWTILNQQMKRRLKLPMNLLCIPTW